MTRFPVLLAASIMLALLSGGVAEGRVRKTRMMTELSSLGRTILLHQTEVGHYPANWNELEKTSPDLDAVFSYLEPKQRVMLLDPPLALPKGRGNGVAVAMTRAPYRSLKLVQMEMGIVREVLGDPVYSVILVNENGGAGSVSFSPAVMSAILREAGRKMPSSKGLGLFRHEREFREVTHYPPTLFVLPPAICLLLLIWAVRIVRRCVIKDSGTDGVMAMRIGVRDSICQKPPRT